MSYTPHTWQPGEIISSARLNALEQGVAAGGGGGYDFVAKGQPEYQNLEFVSGDFAATVAKIQAGNLVIGLYYEYDIDAGNDYCRVVPMFSGMVYTGSNIEMEYGGAYMYWESDDSLWWD